MCGIGVEMMMGAMVICSACFLLIGIYNFPIIVSFHVAVVLFRSREHENCGPQPGYVRAHIESKLFPSLDVKAFKG